MATTIRFTISYFDMAVAFGRLDLPISLSQPASDQGHAAYMAALLCDIKFNSPFSRYDTMERLGPFFAAAAAAFVVLRSASCDSSSTAFWPTTLPPCSSKAAEIARSWAPHWKRLRWRPRLSVVPRT